MSIQISGRVFEDTNYTGGAGTPFGAGDIALANVVVELYDGSGGFIASTVTDAGGGYSFTVAASASYTVRVVSASIGDADTPPAFGFRPGFTSAVAEQTYEHNGVSGNGATGARGGNDAAVSDLATAPGAGSGDTNLTVTASTTNIAGLDFGFTYHLVVNTADSGQGSLRQALGNANALNGVGTVVFSIPGAGVRSIQPLTSLPTIIDPTIVDGTTQPGYAGSPLIELDGSLAGANADGIRIAAGGSTLRGLAINRFSDDGILLWGSGGNSIQGCFIGTDATGTLDRGNANNGIHITSGANLIGGTATSARNIISGNNDYGIWIDGTMASNNTVQGNYIGTNALGSAVIANLRSGVGIRDAANNTIGGTVAGARNVISGNTERGILIEGNAATGNTVQGNYIGLNAAGSAALGNGAGIMIDSAGFSRIGGTTSGARNVISGNDLSGIYLTGSSTIGTLIQGNALGTNAAGTGGVPNLRGIRVDSGVTTLLIGGMGAGASNLIAYNTTFGIRIENSSTIVGVTIWSNRIFANGNLGIDLGVDGVTLNDNGDGDTGPNRRLNFPVIDSVTLSGGNVTISGEARPGATVEFFVAAPDPSGYGEAQTSLGFGVEGSAGDGDAGPGTVDPSAERFSFTLPAAGLVSGARITATATDDLGNTSEFALNVTIP